MQIVDIRKELIGTLLYCYYVSLRSEFLVVMSREGECIIYVICVCLCIVVSNTYCALFCFPSSCVPYVASFSGLSFLDCPFGIL
jgi:hypothetical protein